MRWRPILCVGAALIVGPAHAAAQVPEAPTSWLVSPPDPCLSNAALSSSVARWFGTSAYTGTRRVVLAPGPAPEHVTFVVYEDYTRLGERTFGPLPVDCAERLSALSLAIAISIDRQVLDRIGVVEEAQAESDEPPELETNLDAVPVAEVPEEPPIAEPNDAVDVASTLHLSAQLRASIGFGNLPFLYAGLDLGVRLHQRGWSVRAHLWGSVPRRVELGEGEVEVQALGGFLSGCIERSLNVLEIHACVGVGAGAWFGTGLGFATSLDGRSAFVDATADIGLRIPSDSTIGLVSSFRLRVPILRPSFSVQSVAGERLAQVRSQILAPELFVGLEVELM